MIKQTDRQYCCVLKVHNVLETQFAGLCLYMVGCTFKTPKGNTLSGPVLFLQQDEALNFKQGDLFVR